MNRRRNKATGFTNHIADPDFVFGLYRRFAGCADMLRKRQNNRFRCGQYFNTRIRGKMFLVRGMYATRKRSFSTYSGKT